MRDSWWNAAIKRNVQENIGLKLKSLQLFGVYSGLELYTKPKDGKDEYHIVAIGYLYTEYEGELAPE